MTPYVLKLLNDELDNMIKLGIVEPPKSPWNSISVKKISWVIRFQELIEPLMSNEVPNIFLVLTFIYLLAIIFSIEKFRGIVEGTRFKVCTASSL